MQKPEEVKQVDPSLFLIGGLLEFPVYSFYLGSPNIKGKAYVPNVAPRIGPRIMYKKIGLRMTFALPMPSREEERRGSTEQRNTTLSFYWKKHAFDLYYQYFKGFYLGSPLVEIEENKPNRYTQLPDATSKNWGFNWYYNVNPGQFSLNSAFDQSEFTTPSGGSWVLIPFYRHWNISLGDTIFKGSEPDDIDIVPSFSKGTFETAGSSLAHARSWNMNRYYLSTLAGLGPALQFQRYLRDDIENNKWTLAAKLNLNFSVGWKEKDYTTGAKFILDSIYSRVSQQDVYSSFVSAELFYNQRF